MFANGNILSLTDAEECFKQTGADGVLSAEGILHNPAIFTGKRVPVWTVAEQYLSLAKQHPPPLSYIRGHIFKMFHHSFMVASNLDLRQLVAKTHSVDVFDHVCQQLKVRYEEEYKIESERTDNWRDCQLVPPYICQPYVRPEPKVQDSNSNKRPSSEENESTESEVVLSKKKLKKMNRWAKEVKPKCVSKRVFCTLCPNPKGDKCDYGICRTCCRKKTFSESLDCTGETRANSKGFLDSHD